MPDGLLNRATISVTMTIGNMTRIGKRCTIEAAYIGSNVEIGDDVKIVSARVLPIAYQFIS